jgi:hypothetical protein
VAASAAEVVNADSSIGGGHNLGNPTLATRGQADDVKQPHVAKKKGRKKATRGNGADVIDLTAIRDKRQKAQQDELATRGKTLVGKKTRQSIGPWRVDAVKASAGTWAFRLRRQENGKRSKPIYIRRVANSTYEMIRETNYDGFKQQLVESYLSRAVRAGHVA